MNQLLRVLSGAEALEFGALGLVALDRWRRRGGATRAWLAATFSVLGLFTIGGDLLSSASTRPDDVVIKAFLVLIIAFPYLLYRFMRSMDRPPRLFDWAAAVMTGGLLVVTAALPQFPAAGQQQPAYLTAYGLLFVVQWLMLGGVVTLRLWRAGQGQPTLARRRMRMLSLGSAVLMTVAVIEAAGGGRLSHWSAVPLTLNVIITASGPLFLFGFAPPQVLIRSWRRRVEEEMQVPLAQIMVATGADQVLDGLLPHVAGMVGAQAAAIYDPAGALLGAHGTPPSPDAASGRRSGRVEFAFANATLVVWASPYTPYFGRDVLELLRSLGQLASLALERCRLLRQERTAREALEEAQRIAHLGSWRWEVATGVIDWSTEMFQIHGLDPATFHPTVESLEALCCPDDRQARNEAIRQALAVGGTFEVEYRIVAPDGTLRSLHGLGTVVTGLDGGTSELIGTVQDVTEQRKLEAARSEFIANAAHELRTPLTTIAGMAMLLASHRRELPETVADEAFDALGRQGERARVLINNMLDLSQLDARRIAIHLEVVPLADVVTRARELVLQPEGTAVEVSIANCLSALADPARLEQVLTNLLANAYRYGGPHVRIEAAECEGCVQLAVSDDGPGVPADLVATLFEPFTRGASVAGTVGSGLGLAISRRLVEAFQGRMSYEDQCPHGSRFVVELKRVA